MTVGFADPGHPAERRAEEDRALPAQAVPAEPGHPRVPPPGPVVHAPGVTFEAT